jgi:hypothetical protein
MGLFSSTRSAKTGSSIARLEPAVKCCFVAGGDEEKRKVRAEEFEVFDPLGARWS